MAQIEVRVEGKLIFTSRVQEGDWKHSFSAYYHPNKKVSVQIREGLSRVVKIATCKMGDMATLSRSYKMAYPYDFRSDAVFTGAGCHATIRLDAEEITKSAGMELIAVKVTYTEVRV